MFVTIVELWMYLRYNPKPEVNEFLDMYDEKYIGDYEGIFMITYLTMGLVACPIIFIVQRISGMLWFLLTVIILWLVSYAITGV